MHDCWQGCVEGIDYIECKLCKFVGRSISAHVKTHHHMTKEEYVEKHGPVLAASSKQTYSQVNKENCNWIERAKDAGDDLFEYRTKMRASILSMLDENPAERERRSLLSRKCLSEYSQSERGRKTSSQVAKATSSKPEILRERTERLHTMRKGSKLELCVYRELCSELPQYEWKRNKFIDDPSFDSKTNKRQVDIYSSTTGILVEVDGAQHFGKAYFNDELEEDFSEKKDAELDAYVLREGLTLIRVSYDGYDYRRDALKPRCIEGIKELLQNIKPGINKIGRAYEK